MKTLVYSARDFELPYLKTESKKLKIEAKYISEALNADTAGMAKGFQAISVFTGDDVSAAVIRKLKQAGVEIIVLRSAGYDHIDLQEAYEQEIGVANVPAYSPYAIAEHTVALVLALNRQMIVCQSQVKRLDFTLSQLVGFDLHGKTFGIIGTGKIGVVLAGIMRGFGCEVLAFDINPDTRLMQNFNVSYVTLEELLSSCDIISINLPLNKETHHLISAAEIDQMKKGVMLVNTSRGGILDTAAAIKGMEDGRIGYLGLDVYEKEKGVFFYDVSGRPLQDNMLSKLLRMKNVIVTPHQAFATAEALQNIAAATFSNIASWSNDRTLLTEVMEVHEVAEASK